LVAALNAPPDIAIMVMTELAPGVAVARVVLDEQADLEVSEVDPVPDAPVVLPLTPGMLPPPGSRAVPFHRCHPRPGCSGRMISER
jgi:hypothetical protein